MHARSVAPSCLQESQAKEAQVVQLALHNADLQAALLDCRARISVLHLKLTSQEEDAHMYKQNLAVANAQLLAAAEERATLERSLASAQAQLQRASAAQQAQQQAQQVGVL
jgi:chromosome segregation ATPase